MARAVAVVSLQGLSSFTRRVAPSPSSCSSSPSYGLSGGTFHPLVPFANPDRAPELLKRAWIGIDGDDPARATSRRIAGHIGARTLEIPAGGKGAYHAAAVMSSNFPVVLAMLGVDLLQGLGIPERSAQQAVQSLMEGAVAILPTSRPMKPSLAQSREVKPKL